MSTLTAGRAAEFLPVLESRLPPKTLRHVISVAETLLKVRAHAGITEDQAVAAGLLHDLCKPMQGADLLARAREYGIAVSDFLRERPTLLHGPVAAEESKRTLGVDDAEVFDAIYWHTTGRAEWNPTGVALYFADFSEPLRDRPEAKEARKILDREGYESAVRYVVTAKLKYVEQKHGLQSADIAFRDWALAPWGPKHSGFGVPPSSGRLRE